MKWPPRRAGWLLLFAVPRGESASLVGYAVEPVVAAPIVGALKTSHIDDAIASLSITLTDEEAARLEAPYTARRDIEGISDPKVLAHMMAASGIETAPASHPATPSRPRPAHAGAK